MIPGIGGASGARPWMRPRATVSDGSEFDTAVYGPESVGTPWYTLDFTNWDTVGEMFSEAAHENYADVGAFLTDNSIPIDNKKVWEGGQGDGIGVFFTNTPLNLDNDGVTEVWFDGWVRFDSDWQTDYGVEGSNPDHKTFFIGTNFTYRTQLKFGQGGGATELDNTVGVIEGDGYLTDVQMDLGAEVWDGEWHRLRLYFDFGSAGSDDAVLVMWWDNSLIDTKTGYSSARTAGDVGALYSRLGANFNHGAGIPNPAPKWRWGKCAWYSTDPGWS